MLILSIDTSGKNGSVALARGDAEKFELIASSPVEGGTFSAQLIPQLSRLLSENNLKKSDVDAFTAATGPGSFTGLRIGLTAVKGLAEILHKPIAAVSVLEACVLKSGIEYDDARVFAAGHMNDPSEVVVTGTALIEAAGEVFTEQGYDATTVAQIAERAGVTKSTFFRHFSDKRELLVAGQETLSRLLSEGIAEAPANASPLQAVAAGLERASSAMGPMNRELAPRLKAAVAASAELQERDALKTVGLAAAMTTALLARGVPDSTAAIAAELGVLAFKRGFTEWSEGDRDVKDELARHTLAALDELRAASASLG